VEETPGFVSMGLNRQRSKRYIAEETEIFKRLLAEHNLLQKK
jgi:hypothetical protein